MSNLPFPLRFQRQYAESLDADMVFDTSLEMSDYLSNARRYAGQVATCLEEEGKIYILNNAKDDWLEVEGGGGGTMTIYTETPSGAINGVNKSYTTLHKINTVMSFAINGQFIHPDEYSVSDKTITFVDAIHGSLSGKPFTIIYA